MLNRRDFIKIIGGLGVFVLTPIDKLVGKRPLSLTSINTEEGELYAGFYLLPQDAPLPSFIDIGPVPILGHVAIEDESRLAKLRGTTSYFGDAESLKKDIQLPVFMPGTGPNMTFMMGYVTRFSESSEVWEIGHSFGSKDDQGPRITFVTRPVFPHPCPMWPVVDLVKVATANVWEKVPVINPEKVQFTPTPGILLPTDQGHALQWIDHDILYAVFIENQGRREFAESFISSIVKI